MKIAFFTDTYLPAIDGVVRSIELYRRALGELGHEVRVFAPAPENPSKKFSWASYCPSAAFPPYPQYRVPLSLSPCVREAVEFKPDIVHCHAMALMAIGAKKAAKECGAPLVGTFHTMLPEAGHYISDVEGVRLWFENACWKYLQWLYGCGFSKIFCPSGHVKKKLSKYGIAAQVLPNPVDTRKFSGGKIDSRAKAWFGKGAVLYLGRVAKEKNLDFLLEIAAREEFASLGAKILIAGGGPYLDGLGKKVAKMGLGEKVSFSGKVEERLLPSFYSLAKCCIFPSFFETQGMSALESMACGTPVVALENTAMSEFIENGKNGYCSPPDAKAAAGMLRLAVEGKGRMGAHARKTALRYSVDKCAKGLLGAYARALSGKK